MFLKKLTGAICSAVVFVAVCLAVTGPASASKLGDKWNGSQIEWLDYEAAKKASKKSRKPIMILFHAEWCPTCRDFRAEFKNRELVALSKKFSMVIVDTDQQPEVSKKYENDGGYVPRIYFTDPKGKVLPLSTFDYDSEAKHFTFDIQEVSSIMNRVLKWSTF